MKTKSTFLLVFFYYSLFAQWSPLPGPETGNIYCSEWVNDEIWAGTSEAFFRSIDFGESWESFSLTEEDETVVDIKVYGEEILMLVGTSQSTPYQGSFRIYRSQDNGISWTILDTPFSEDYHGLNTIFKIDNWLFFVSDTQLHRLSLSGGNWETPGVPWTEWPFIMSNGQQLFQANENGLFRSDDYGDNWIQLQTTPGTRFSFVEGDSIYFGTADDLLFSPDLGDSWETRPLPNADFSGTFQRGELSGNIYAFNQELYFSENDGLSWQQLSIPLSYFSGQILESGQELLFRTRAGFFKSVDNGFNWTPSNTGILSGQTWGLFNGENNWLVYQANYGVFASPDQGETWVDVDFPASFAPVLDAAFSSDTTFLLSPAGVTMHLNDFTTTVNLPNPGFSLQSNHFLYDKGHMFVSAENQLYHTTDLWQTSEIVNNPFMGFVFWEDIVASDQFILATTSDSHVYRSPDYGQSWEEVLDYTFFPFNNDHRIHQFEDQLIIMGANTWFVSQDEGATWQFTVPLGLPDDEDTGFMIPSSLVQTDEGIFFADIEGEGLFFSADNGMNWTPYTLDYPGWSSGDLTAIGNSLFLGTLNQGIWSWATDLESISGTVYLDSNNNGIQDSTEEVLPQQLVFANPSGIYTTTDQNGAYSLFAEGLQDSVRVSPPVPFSYSNPDHYLIDQSAVDLDFGIHVPDTIENLRLTLTSTGYFVPGFQNLIFATIENLGGNEVAPVVKMVFPQEVAIDLASPDISYMIGDTLFWEMDSLSTFENSHIQILVTTNQDAPLGDYVHIEGWVFSDNQDAVPTDNYDEIHQEIVGSYDPNDKTAEPMDAFPLEDLGQDIPIIYTIRFQNTGTFPAQTVRIVDTLQQNLDLYSIKVLAASHDFTWSLQEPRVLEFLFENIMLPDSTSNEVESHGFIKFSILPIADLELGEKIENTAFIYFDFNDPIQTNTEVNVIVTPTATFRIQRNDRFKVFPNPSNGAINLQLEKSIDGAAVFQLFDLKGRQLFSTSIVVEAGLAKLELPSLSDQLLLGVLKINGREYVQKIMMQTSR